MSKIIAGTVIEEDGRFLLVQEARSDIRGKWNIPAGHAEDTENLIQAAERETFEETGCQVTVTGFIKVCDRLSSKGDNRVVVFIFLADLISGRPEEFRSDEILQTKWFTFEEILQLYNDGQLRGNFIVNSIRRLKEQGSSSIGETLEVE